MDWNHEYLRPPATVTCQVLSSSNKMGREETLVDFTCYFNPAIPRRLPGLPFSLPFCPLKHFTSLFYFCQTTLDYFPSPLPLT